jgi:site-specific DNA recombinase
LIADALNTEGEPGPRGAVDGILCKELYIDVRAYNLRSFKRHLDTARRCGRLSPESEWLREPVPWRSLVVDDLWVAVQARLKAAGLGMTLNGGWFACSAAHERGTCTNKKLIAAKHRGRADGPHRRQAPSPQAIAAAVSFAQTEAIQRQYQTLRARASMEKELAEICYRLDRMQALCIAEAASTEELKAKRIPLMARRAELRALLAETAEPKPCLRTPAWPTPTGAWPKSCVRSSTPNIAKRRATPSAH